MSRFSVLLGPAVVSMVACAPPTGTRAASPRAQPQSTHAAAPVTSAPGPNRPPEESAGADLPCNTDAGADADLSSVEVISPNDRVPAFHVTTVDCQQLRSRDLVGRRPFVLVFFSSWCGVCEKKMPVVQAAMDAIGTEMTFLGVALDDADSWDEVPGFVERFGLEFPLIRGDHHPRFTMGYNPFQSIPVVVIVGPDGYIIDLQVGYSPFDYNRLLGAAELAKKRASAVAPDATPEPDAPAVTETHEAGYDGS